MTHQDMRLDSPVVGWQVSDNTVGYAHAVAFMESHAREIADGRAGELVWLLEHEPLYTAGTSAKPHDLIEPDRFPVHVTGRGGQYTYHGPGQRIAYVMLDLKARGGDVRAFVQRLERWLIETLAVFGVEGSVRPGRIGVWVERIDAHGVMHDEKIAALGIRVVRGVSYHGIALNVSPELSHFSGIVPCGLAGFGVTSLAALGKPANIQAVDEALRSKFEALFGRTELVVSEAVEAQQISCA